MSTYKELFGKYVQSIASDPTTAVAEGQIWYNTTSNTFKSLLSAGSWSAGGNLSSARTNGCAGGLQSSALYAGGGSPGGATELYNGTAWTGSGAMNTNRFGHRGAGTQTSYIMAGNDPSNVAESFNGSSWTTEAVYPSSVSMIGASGTDAAAVFFGGGTRQLTATVYWNGSSWSDQSVANQGGAANNGPMGASQSDALFLSGTSLGSPALIGRTQIWNGSSWTSQGTASLQKDSRMNMSQSSTYAVSAGGRSPYSVVTELFDGSAWSTTTSLTTAQAAGGGAGSASSGLTFGGNYPGSPDVYNGTQEWDVSTTIVVPATWSSGGNLVNTRDSMMTAAQATQPAAFIFGGHNNSGTLTFSESYNGSSWTSTNALPVAKQLGGGAGVQTAALCFGGQTSPPATTRATTETWDGSNWTAVAAPGGTLGTGRHNGGSAGLQDAALLFGGTPSTANSEEWNGSSWTEGNNLSRGTTGSTDICGAGIQTSALAMGGTAPSFVYNTVEEYNGTSWTGGGGLNTARRRAAAAASTTDAGLCFGGLASPGSGQTAVAELYNGTAWTNTASMGTARYYLGGSGATQGDGFAFGGLLTGAASSFTDKTEEFTAPDPSALNIKTLTTS